jgi:predicted amidophosphoribosyltransferase
MHCQALLEKRKGLFCPSCLEQISLVDREERCRTCFAELYKGRCERCMHRSVVIHHQIAACEPMGPAKTLLSGIDKGRRECIPAAASLMAYQWLKQKMPVPDLIIPLPSSFWKRQQHGFDAKRLLANEIGKIFSCPVLPVLRQTFDREHFLTQGEFRFRIYPAKKRRASLCDQRLLLVTPVLDDNLCRRVGKELQIFFPEQIQVLAFTVPWT